MSSFLTILEEVLFFSTKQAQRHSAFESDPKKQNVGKETSFDIEQRVVDTDSRGKYCYNIPSILHTFYFLWKKDKNMFLICMEALDNNENVCLFVCLEFIVPIFHIYIETSPLSMIDCEFWSMLGTHDN